MKKLNFSDFIKCVGWSKHEYYMMQHTKKIMNGGNGDEVEVSDEDYEEAMSVLAERQRKDELLFRTVSRNNKGIELESNGDIDGAIKVYEENISEGYPATHSFKRLMILYRKRKEYDKEIRVILRAMDVLSNEDLSKRLAKAKELQNKAR